MGDILNWVAQFLFIAIRISTPLIYVAVCAVISQQAGLLNMAAESMMLPHRIYLGHRLLPNLRRIGCQCPRDRWPRGLHEVHRNPATGGAAR